MGFYNGRFSVEKEPKLTWETQLQLLNNILGLRILIKTKESSYDTNTVVGALN